MSDSPIFIGIETQHAWRLFTFSALDANLRLLTQQQGKISDVVAYLAEVEQALVAVCAPPSPSSIPAQQQEIHTSLFASQPGEQNSAQRPVELELARHNLPAPRTPGEAAACPAWMRRGFRLHQEAAAIGYLPAAAAPPSARHVIETVPEAIYTSLLGHAPLPWDTLEGRIQRQLVLWDNRLPVRDPMNYYEEITRHKLLKGILPDQDILPLAQLNALAAAFTAYLVGNRAERVTRYGEPTDGEIYLPRMHREENAP